MRRAAWLLAAGLSFAPAVSAQAPAAALDAAAYPALAAMRTWLANGSREAAQCALSGGLFLEADAIYRQARNEPRTVAAMLENNGDKLSPAERERLRGFITNIVSMAAALGPFAADSAAVAFSQMCVSRAQDPKSAPGPDAIRQQFAAATACEAKHPAGSLARKDCVATAFRTP